MATWSLVATVKAPEEKLLAFAAYHLSLGAEHLWLFLDDPDQPVPELLARHPRVTVTRCDEAHWTRVGKKRPPAHQNRQAQNARYAYRKQATSDWIVHIDVDEFILAPRPIAAILDDTPPETIVMKLEPFEAMHDPLLPDDIFTSREFRGALRHEYWPRRRAALGPYRKVIRDGMLSHSVGKVIYRTGIPGLLPRLHTVMVDKEFVRTPDWHPEMQLLHFHAQDKPAWLAAVPFRMTKGAYQFRPELQAFLAEATPEEVDRFYRRTQILPVDLRDELAKVGRVVLADLHLRQKVEALRDGQL
ncbi:glycosyltransferase family 2 protein [Tabrizicola sp.]|uniref:glycosyltransferase family 2 protein n=1 Tax=Tabrizicola sp. TaxID=2005166 RepID=UPI001A540CB0|nr:glycosyltransferase family 2 protein [Tabrizicola sp.]MBL9073818.1 glycosyltransferase family 2 protein [Tabrizicola sp.]